MSLDKHIEKFGKEFVSIPVCNLRYWKDLGMYIGETLVADKNHSISSTIAFEFFDELGKDVFLAYKPLSCYK
jgi:hypothetical protein